MPQIPFGEWLPDDAQYSHANRLVVCDGAYPTKDGYKPYPKWVGEFGPIEGDGHVRDSVTGKTPDGTGFNVAATATKLWRAKTGSFTDVSKGGSPYATNGERWEVALFGSFVVATNYQDEVQFLNADTGSAFADIFNLTPPSTVPKARHLGVVRDFVVLGNVNDSGNTGDGVVVDRIHWGPIGDPFSARDWPIAGTDAALGVQSDFRDLRGQGGEVRGIAGMSEIGIVFLERQVWRMDYVGGSTIFQLTMLESDRGLLVPQAFAVAGRLCFYLATDGFRMTDGGQSIPIGREKVDRWLFSRLDTDHLDRISVSVDPSRHLFLFGFPLIGSAGQPGCILLYDWVLRRWSKLDFDHNHLSDYLDATGILLDVANAEAGWDPTNDLDNAGLYPTDFDELGVSKNPWYGGAFDSDNQLGTFTGNDSEVLLDTGFFEPVPGRWSYIKGVRPNVSGIDPSNLKVSVSTSRKAQVSDPSWSVERVANEEGVVCTRSSGRYARFRFRSDYEGSTDAAFHGFDAEAIDDGSRG